MKTKFQFNPSPKSLTALASLALLSQLVPVNVLAGPSGGPPGASPSAPTTSKASGHPKTKKACVEIADRWGSETINDQDPEHKSSWWLEKGQKIRSDLGAGYDFNKDNRKALEGIVGKVFGDGKLDGALLDYAKAHSGPAGKSGDPSAEYLKKAYDSVFSSAEKKLEAALSSKPSSFDSSVTKKDDKTISAVAEFTLSPGLGPHQEITKIQLKLIAGDLRIIAAGADSVAIEYRRVNEKKVQDDLVKTEKAQKKVANQPVPTHQKRTYFVHNGDPQDRGTLLKDKAKFKSLDCVAELNGLGDNDLKTLRAQILADKSKPKKDDDSDNGSGDPDGNDDTAAVGPSSSGRTAARAI